MGLQRAQHFQMAHEAGIHAKEFELIDARAVANLLQSIVDFIEVELIARREASGTWEPLRCGAVGSLQPPGHPIP